MLSSETVAAGVISYLCRKSKHRIQEGETKKITGDANYFSCTLSMPAVGAGEVPRGTTLASDGRPEDGEVLRVFSILLFCSVLQAPGTCRDIPEDSRHGQTLSRSFRGPDPVLAWWGITAGAEVAETLSCLPGGA